MGKINPSLKLLQRSRRGFMYRYSSETEKPEFSFGYFGNRGGKKKKKKTLSKCSFNIFFSFLEEVLYKCEN